MEGTGGGGQDLTFQSQPLRGRGADPDSKGLKVYVCSNQLDNLEETGAFLERHKQPKLTPKEMENPNSLTTSKEIELKFRFPQGQTLAQMASLVNLTKHK